MATTRQSKTPLQALIGCIHEVQPPVFSDGVRIYTDPNKGGDSVTVTFAMTPELAKAWSDACDGLLAARTQKY